MNANSIAKEIKETCKNFVEGHWKRRTGEKDLDENSAFDRLFGSLRIYEAKNYLKTGNEEYQKLATEIRGVLDTVAKENMSMYYNMLLPQTVHKSHFSNLFSLTLEYSSSL